MLQAWLLPFRFLGISLTNFCPLGLLLVLGIFSLSGCKTAEMVAQKMQTRPETAEPSYHSLVLDYETKSLNRLFCRGKKRHWKTEIASLVSTENVKEKKSPLEAAGPDCKWSRARIQIVYPHPDGSKEKGLAKLIVSRHSPLDSNSSQTEAKTGAKLKDSISRMMLKASGVSPDLTQLVGKSERKSDSIGEEIWQLDLPKETLDILLSELSQHGFFNKQERPCGEAVVSVFVDQGELSKRWTSEPRLEDLMQKIYNEGELSAFNTKKSRIESASFSSEDKYAVRKTIKTTPQSSTGCNPIAACHE